jgi:diguanylate cyclase
MTVHADEHERTMAFAEIALGQIRALRQPASPRHFEIWYTYATGYNPSLNQTINETLARNGTLTDADIDAIYESHISAHRFTDRIDSVGTRVKGEIEQVMSMIAAAVGSATSYSESLADASSQLGGAADGDALRAIVSSLVENTKEMEQANRALEARLNESKKEIDELQVNLEAVRNESLTDPKELMKRSTGEHLGRITISIGVATLTKTDTAQSLIERADACLYAAKRAGRNRVISEADPELGSAEPAKVA